MILLQLPKTTSGTTIQPVDIDCLLHEVVMAQAGYYQLLYVGAPWCAPCKGLRPVFSNILATYADIICFEINLDDELSYQDSNLLRSLPAILLFEEGKVVQQLNGLVTTDKIHQLLRAYPSGDSLEQGADTEKENLQLKAVKKIHSLIAVGDVAEATRFYQGLGADIKYQSNLQQVKSLLDLVTESQQELNAILANAELYPVYQLFTQLKIDQGLDLLLQLSKQGTFNRQLYIRGLNTLMDKHSAKHYRQQLSYK
ncbi:MAG: thioredoxin family protein [Oleispira sp.]|nr:thioredoxin family protein [Oleispira sp.]